ncbi:MAG: ATP-binding protein, partial [Planctomycetes bacterium]|nr:ATP-binding protein [Planctomycetota bacterium]
MFQFDAADIPPWISTISGTIVQLLPNHNLHTEIGRRPVELSIPISAAWLLLDVCTRSTLDFDHPTNDPLPDTYTDPEEWFADPSRLELVRESFKQFSRDVLVEVGVVRGSYQLRYITPRPFSGPLADLLQARDSALRAPEHDAQILPAFPFDLLIDCSGPDGERLVATPWVPAFPEKTHSSAFDSDFFRLEKPIPESDSIDELRRAESDLMEHFIRPSVSEVTDDSIVAEFHGLERFSKAVESLGLKLKDLDIGIDSLRLNVLHKSSDQKIQNATNDEIISYAFEKLEYALRTGLQLPFGIRIEWRAPDDKTWRTLDSASDGQKRLMTTLLRIERIQSMPHSVLLSDEFDARLHPTTALELIRLMDTYMDSIGAVGFFSTHNASYASSAKNPNLYAYRDQNGQFGLTIDPVESDISSLKDILGTSDLDLIGLRRLVVVVEGYHDLRVIQKLVEGEKDILQYVWIVQSEGIRNFGLLWDVLLNRLSVPILFVHDKRNRELEECVEKLRKIPKVDDPWEKSGLA